MNVSHRSFDYLILSFELKLLFLLEYYINGGFHKYYAFLSFYNAACKPYKEEKLDS